MTVVVRHLVAAHKIADVLVQDIAGKGHRVGHHPSYGWQCITCDSSRCPAVAAAKAAVVPLEEA